MSENYNEQMPDPNEVLQTINPQTPTIDLNTQNQAELLKKVTENLYANNLELNKERNRIRKILLSVAEIIFAIDQDYKITLFNEKAEKIFGYKIDQVRGQPVYKYINLMNDETKERIKSKDYAFTNNDTSYERVKVNTKGQEGQYYKLRSSFIDFGDGKREAVIALSNITTEVEIDKQKDEFISIASHELKTPISITKNNLWMFTHVSKKDFSKRELRFLDEMSEGIARLQKIVNNLLDISRIQQGRLVVNMEMADICTETLKILDNFKELAEKKGLKLVIPSCVPFQTLIDKERFAECIENLVSNAIKYTNIGSVTLTFEPTEKLMKIIIKDTGPGIPEKDFPKIFTKFGRASEGLKLDGASTANSTGLGLYITKNYVKAMKGDIGFTSEVGKGTTFWFTIPKLEPDPNAQSSTLQELIKQGNVKASMIDEASSQTKNVIVPEHQKNQDQTTAHLPLPQVQKPDNLKS